MKVLMVLFFCITTIFANKQILLLHSYNKGLKWSDDISLGVEQELSSYKQAELTTEYMDSKKNHSTYYKNIIYKAFLQKFEFRKYDVVIVADNYAINFYKKYKDKIFLDSKVIFIGVDKDSPGIDIDKVLKLKIPIVLENKKAKTNVDFILSQIKDIKTIYLINDTSLSSSLINKRLKEILKNTKKEINFFLDIDGNVTKTSKNIDALPKNSVVLFGSLFVDSSGNYIPYYEVNSMINSSKFPVFSLTDSHLGKGVIGGILSTGFEQGVEGGKLALKYLKNQKVDTSKPILAKAKWMFDFDVLKKYDLLDIDLPKDSIILNKPKNFFEKYRQVINTSFIVYPIIFLLLIFIILIIINKIKTDKKLLEQKYLSQKQLDFIQEMIFWINENGTIIDCNKAFLEFINLTKEEILNKHIKDLSYCLDIKNFLHLNSFEFKCKNRIYHVKNSSISYEESKTNFFIISDVTTLKESELNKQFLIQQSKLSEIGEMLSSLSHQWKTPLVELSAVAHKMQHYHRLNKLTNQNIEVFFKIIMEQIMFMSDTVDGIRAFIKPSNKSLLFDIDLGIKEILNITNQSLKYNYIDIEYLNILNKAIYIKGYPNEFKQVILNIINNAKDSILENKKSKNYQKGKITIHLNQIQESVKIVIEDNGVGIDKKLEDKIFNPYFTTKKDGVGIGLHMAKVIIENKMEGKLRAYALENGVKFVITLPKANA